MTFAAYPGFRQQVPARLPRPLHPTTPLLLAALFLAAGAAKTPAMAQLQLSGLRRVAEGPGVRNRPAVVVGPTDYAIFWEEAPAGAPAAGQRADLRLVRQRMGFDGVLLGTPEVVMDQWSRQGRAAPVAGPGGAWLAYEFTDLTLREGDRDLGLVRFDGFFDRPGASLLVTSDSPEGTPVTQAAPALLFEPATRQLVLASSVAVYQGERPGRHGPHDSVNIEIRVMDLEGGVTRHFVVKGPDQSGESATPTLTILPASWRERYILGYASNAGRRGTGDSGYSVWLELFNRDWRVVGGRHLSKPTKGAADPSLVTVDGKLYAAWVDNTARDIVVSELDENLHPVWPMPLGQALAAAGFAEQSGGGAPRFGAPMLFHDFGYVGIAFVATWDPEPGQEAARQEVYVARVRYR